MRGRTLVGTLVALVVAANDVAWSQFEEASLAGHDEEAGDALGESSDIDGATLIAGAKEAGTGAAYVFTRDNGLWIEEAKLEPSDGDGERFGASVTISGNWAAVGSLGSGSNDQGAVYIFRRTGTFPFAVWAEHSKLAPAGGSSGNEFGRSVSLSGDTLAIGTRELTGRVYVYRRSGGVWMEETKLSGMGQSAGDNFANSVALSGDLLCVGSSADDDKGLGSGSVYIFARSGTAWAESQKLLASNGTSNDEFGQSVDTDGATIVVGTQNAEAAYAFEWTGSSWAESQVLTSTYAAPPANFGWSVAVEGAWVVVGAIRYNNNVVSPDQGTAVAFERDGSTWIERGLLSPNNPSSSGVSVGISVGVSGDTAVVGAPTAGPGGRVYVYSVVPPTPITYCTGKVNSQGCLPAMSFSGVASVSDPVSFDVGAVQVLNNKAGLLFYGVSARTSFPFQGGTLCTLPPLRRTPVQNSGGNPPPNDCSGVFSFDFNARIQSGVDPALAAGVLVYAQYWYRDPLVGSTTGLTDGLQFGIGF